MPISSHQQIYSFEHKDSKYSDDQDIGYLVTIPYWAGEKKSIQKVIELFSTEAFEGGREAIKTKRIALLIGVNQKKGTFFKFCIPDSTYTPQFDVKIIDFSWDSDDGKPNMGEINNFIKESQVAIDLITKLRDKGAKKLYIAKFDADTISLNNCFSYYEEQINKHYKAKKKLPVFLTSGYITKHERPEEHALEVGTKLDYLSRMAISRHLPFSPYITEANALILIPEDQKCLKEQYSKTCEMSGLVKSIFSTRQIDCYDDFIFVENCPITTDYRPDLRATGTLNFKGTFENGKFVEFGYSDIKQFRERAGKASFGKKDKLEKLNGIWQTHYGDDRSFYEKSLQDDIFYAIGYNVSKNEFQQVGRSIALVTLYIHRLFDPITITKHTLPEYVNKKIDECKMDQFHDEEFIRALAYVISDYSSYVGWRRPKESGPSPYKIDSRSRGISIKLNEESADPLLKDLEQNLYLENLEKKLIYLLYGYVLSSILLQKYKKLEEVDTLPTLEEIKNKIKEEKKDDLSFDFNKLEEKIEKFVSGTINAAHEKGLAITTEFSSTLLLDHNQRIPGILEGLCRKSTEKKQDATWPKLYLDIFSKVYDGKYQKQDILKKGKYNNNIMHVLALLDDWRLLHYLLIILDPANKKQLLSAKNDAGLTPAELAFKFNHKRQTALMVTNGEITDLLVNGRTIDGETLLHIVAAYCYSPKVLIDVKSKVKLRKDEEKSLKEKVLHPDILNLTNYCGETPLHTHLSHPLSSLKVCQELTSDDNYDLSDDDDFTPLVLASQDKNNSLIMKFLVERGADSTSRCEHAEQTPFEQAVENNDVTLVELMLNKGAKIEGLKWLFHDSDITQNYGMLNLLLSHANKLWTKSRLNTLDVVGNAPIHIAIKYKHPHAIPLLLSYGTNFELKNADGLTPLQLAHKLGFRVALSVLSNYCSRAGEDEHKRNIIEFFKCTKHGSSKSTWTEKITSSKGLDDERLHSYKESKTAYRTIRSKLSKSSIEFH